MLDQPGLSPPSGPLSEAVLQVLLSGALLARPRLGYAFYPRDVSQLSHDPGNAEGPEVGRGHGCEGFLLYGGAHASADCGR